MANDNDSPGSPLLEKATYTLYKRRWLILAVYSLISMANEVIWISLSSINNIVKVYYGVSSLAVNWLSMIYLAMFICVAFTSYILDNYGLRFTIIIGAALNGIRSCLRCIGSSRDGFIFVFLGSAFSALAQTFLLFIPPRLAAAWFGEHERATASAIGVLMTMSGVAVGFLMGTMVPNSQDMDNAVRIALSKMLITQAVVCSVLVILAVVFVQDAPPTPPSRSQELFRQIKEGSLLKKVLERGNTPFPRNDEQLKNYATINAENGQTKEAQNSDADVGDMTSKIRSLKIPNLRESILILSKDISFHLLCQAYAIYYALICAYSTILNQMIITKHPGKEKEIGYLGFSANLLGVSGMFLNGIWLDKTKRFRTLSISVNIICALTILIFTLLLTYHDNFTILFISFCVFGLFSYPYMSAGLEHAAEITYPIPEGTTSGILLLSGSIYGIIIIYIFGAVLERKASGVVGYIMVALYFICTVLTTIGKAPLKRSEADKTRA